MKCDAHQIPFCTVCTPRRDSVSSKEVVKKKLDIEEILIDYKIKIEDKIEIEDKSKIEVVKSKEEKLLERFSKLPKCFVPEQIEKNAVVQVRLAEKHLLWIGEARKTMQSDISWGVGMIFQLLSRMVLECFELLGKSPTPICILGAGSFGRREMMPFSDCDLCFLYDNTKSGANAYVGDLLGLLIFKAKLVAFLADPECDTIPEGFSIDQEFEGNPEKVATLCVVGGMTLCDVCPVVLDKELLVLFEECLTQAIKGNGEAVGMVVGEVLKHSAIFLNKKPSGKIDIKNHLYRPLQKFVSLLALLFDDVLREHKNSVDRLQVLLEKKLIDPELGKLLVMALEYVLAIRLHWHSKQEKADDQIPVSEMNPEKLAMVLKAIAAIHERLGAFKSTRCTDRSVFGPVKKKFYFF